MNVTITDIISFFIFGINAWVGYSLWVIVGLGNTKIYKLFSRGSLSLMGFLFIGMWLYAFVFIDVGVALGALVLLSLLLSKKKANEKDFVFFMILTLLLGSSLIASKIFTLEIVSNRYSFFPLNIVSLSTSLIVPLIGLTMLLPYILSNLIAAPVKATIIIVIILINLGIYYLIDPIKSDFYLYLNKREKIVFMIETNQIKIRERLILDNPQEFHVRSVHIQKKINESDEESQNNPTISSIYLERYTVNFGENSGGYIYTKDEEYTAELNGRKAKKLKEHWFWRG